MVYVFIALMLLAVELVYFKIADKCNIIDKPNERSSHSTIVLRGGGIIFAISMLVWSLTPFLSPTGERSTLALMEYWPFIVGLMLICGVSFWDDVKSLPDSVRLVAHFAAMALMFWNLGIMHWNMWWFVVLALIVCVGATNIINFMDGINGITATYALAVLLPLALVNSSLDKFGITEGTPGMTTGFIEPSYLVVAIIGVLVFSIFNFRPKGKAKCFAGDVGSVGIAFIMLFAIGKLVLLTNDLTWLTFLIVYGVDGCCTIVHRIMLHENLGEAHRKHAYQLMANELGMSHVVVSCIYMVLQLAISLVMVYAIPNTLLAHWIYLVGTGIMLVVTYVLFMRKYYHLHAEYLQQLKVKNERWI